MVMCKNQTRPQCYKKGRNKSAWIVGFTIGFPDFVAEVPIDLLGCQIHAYPYAILLY